MCVATCAPTLSSVPKMDLTRWIICGCIVIALQKLEFPAIVMEGEESGSQGLRISPLSKQSKRTTTIKRAKSAVAFSCLWTLTLPDCSNSFPFMILFMLHTLKLSHVFNKMETGSRFGNDWIRLLTFFFLLESSETTDRKDIPKKTLLIVGSMENSTSLSFISLPRAAPEYFSLYGKGPNLADKFLKI